MHDSKIQLENIFWSFRSLQEKKRKLLLEKKRLCYIVSVTCTLKILVLDGDLRWCKDQFELRLIVKSV